MQGTMSQPPPRDAALDVFRCVLMFLVVLHHAAFHGIYAGRTAYWSLPLLFTSLIVWHVDGFIAISGWFGLRPTTFRVCRILGVILFYSVVRFIYLFFFLHEPLRMAVRLSGGWFGNWYLVFLFAAPFVDAAVRWSLHAGIRRGLAILFAFDIAMAAHWAAGQYFPEWGIHASGFSISTFLLVYANVRFARLSGLDAGIPGWFIPVSAIAFAAGALLCAVLPAAGVLVREGSVPQAAAIGHSTYNAPHVALMAFAMLLFFERRVRPPPWLARTCSRLSPLMFGVYLAHTQTGVGAELYRMPERWLASGTSFHPAIVVLCGAVVAFSACSAVDLVRRLSCARLCVAAGPLCCAIDVRIRSAFRFWTSPRPFGRI